MTLSIPKTKSGVNLTVKDVASLELGGGSVEVVKVTCRGTW